MGSAGGSTGYMNREIGYNKENIESIREEINNQAQDTAKKIVSNINSIVSSISELWFSEVAVEYFKEFANDISSYAPKITNAFEQFNQKIAEAGAEWAAKTEVEAPNLAPIDSVTLDIDISPIKAVNAGGDRYITTGLAEEVSSLVSIAKGDITEYITDIAERADVSLAFIGGEQSEGVRNCASALKQYVEDMLSFLDSGEHSIVTKLEAYDTEYQRTAQSNVDLFTDSAFTDVQ